MNELITTRSLEIVTGNYCRSCGTALFQNDRFCGDCGAACSELVVPSEPRNPLAPQPSKELATVDNAATIQAVVNSRTFVVGMIAVAGPLGLLALWFNQRFSNRTKIITTVAYVLLAIVLPLVVVWYWLDVALRPLLEIFAK